MRRRPVVVRRGPGLLGTMAVGGVAYAAGRGGAQQAAQEQALSEQIAQLQAEQQALAAQQRAGVAVPPTVATQLAAAPIDRVAQLKDLAQLKDAGVLSDEEFEREKQRILSGA